MNIFWKHRAYYENQEENSHAKGINTFVFE